MQARQATQDAGDKALDRANAKARDLDRQADRTAKANQTRPGLAEQQHNMRRWFDEHARETRAAFVAGAQRSLF
jgi:hypothetical protein